MTFSMIDYLIRYEQDGLNNIEVLELFSHLIKKGYAWQLQGSYGRTAKDMIDRGLINKDGVISDNAEEILIG